MSFTTDALARPPALRITAQPVLTVKASATVKEVETPTSRLETKEVRGVRSRVETANCVGGQLGKVWRAAIENKFCIAEQEQAPLTNNKMARLHLIGLELGNQRHRHVVFLVFTEESEYCSKQVIFQ